MKINPRVGAGPLVLGMTREAIRAAVGAPDRTEDFSDSPEASIDWHYDDAGFSLYFDAEEQYRLNLITIELPAAEFDGQRPIGMTEEQALSAYPTHGLFLDEDADLAELGIRHYEITDGSVSLCFQDGVCSSVSITVYIDDADQLVWP